jgi:outer membrane lipoprotein carrier protein
MMLRYLIPTLSLLLLVALVAAPSSAQSVDEIAQRLNAKYQSLQSIKAEFTQTMTSEFSDLREQKNGQLVLRGDDYRLDTGDEVYARRGDNVWRYARGDNQVIISDAMDDEGSFSVNDLFFRYDELFNFADVRTEQYEGTRHYRLTLRPKQEDAFFREVTLWLRDRDDIVTRLHMVDLNGTIMEFRLRNVELNTRIASSTFDPPSGARVVDLR